jgi:hypothetical protein
MPHWLSKYGVNTAFSPSGSNTLVRENLGLVIIIVSVSCVATTEPLSNMGGTSQYGIVDHHHAHQNAKLQNNTYIHVTWDQFGH